MAALNRFDIIGRLTRDPEVRTTNSGKEIINISIAQNKVWKDQAGAKQEKSLFFSITAYGKVGEILKTYLKKGQRVYFSSTVEPYEREKDDGTKIYGTSFIIQDFEFLEPKKKDKETISPEDAEYIYDLPV